MDGNLEKSKDALLYGVVGEGVGKIFHRRVTDAQIRLNDAVGTISGGILSALPGLFAHPLNAWASWREYIVDSAQRGALFWDTLRQRGDNFMEQLREGEPPVLHFDYEIVMDARGFDRPVNYALARIIAPEGVTVHDRKRPYIIIDPRAGQVPGIGGFKDDSQVGVALRAGHPVYFLIFYALPEPGQTMLDVTAAEQVFIKKVRELHPQSNRPVLVGNCQAGWAVMMLASVDPEDVGAILINGAPLSYWGGAWTEGKGNNIMRYAGGVLGGSWMASLASDIGNGRFDGAHLVQGFEYLNPSNTLWTKYRTVYSRIDTEPPRFLEFERWWGAFSLMNAEEIEWIVQNLFIGNDLWSGRVLSRDGKAFDLRNIKAPTVLFASLGDNITPPQQAFNWVADTYASTDEIKARGQVIVGLLHESIGHLGIFVSGKVAKKEYTELVSVIRNIEMLPPGLYGMSIKNNPNDKDGTTPYIVDFVEFRLEDVVRRLNRADRLDEIPFVAVQLVSELNQSAYNVLLQPLVQNLATEEMARLLRVMHPDRVDKWSLASAVNPWMAALQPWADMVRQQRKPAAASNIFSLWEDAFSQTVVALLDYGRDVRDALEEAWFFNVYSSPAAIRLVRQHGQDYFRKKQAQTQARSPLEIPYIRDALDAMEKGGLAAALARTDALLCQHGAEVLSLKTLEQANVLFEKYGHVLPALGADEFRRIRGEQQLVCRYAPEQALGTLPKLLQNRRDRRIYLRALDLLEQGSHITPHGALSHRQCALVHNIRQLLGPPIQPAAPTARQRAGKPPPASARPAPSSAKAAAKTGTRAVAKATPHKTRTTAAMRKNRAGKV